MAKIRKQYRREANQLTGKLLRHPLSRIQFDPHGMFLVNFLTCLLNISNPPVVIWHPCGISAWEALFPAVLFDPGLLVNRGTEGRREGHRGAAAAAAVAFIRSATGHARGCVRTELY